MGKPDDQPMKLFTMLASATVTAYALAYIAHFELGLSRLKIREDALAAVGLLVVALTVKSFFGGKTTGDSESPGHTARPLLPVVRAASLQDRRAA
jgi:hypothetical protein